MNNLTGAFRKLASGAIKTFSEPSSGGEGPTEASAYKQLLVELQYNQLLVSREYQELFKQKEEEIKRLKKLAGEVVEGEDEAATKKETHAAAPLEQLSAEDLKPILKEWERKMKNNIVQKTEALAEAQIYRESVELLRTQLDQQREIIAKLEKQSQRQGSHDQSRAEHQAAMDRLVQEFELVQREAQKAKEKLAQAELEIQALRTKAESDAKTLALLSDNNGSEGNTAEFQQILKERQEESSERIAALERELAAQQLNFNEELAKAQAELEEARASMEQLTLDLASALETQANVVMRMKKEAEQATQVAVSERDEALQKLKEGETNLKDALEKLARAEIELQRVTKDYEEATASRSLSSQQDVEQKEAALQSARKELQAAERALDELKASSVASLDNANNALAAKENELASIREQVNNLEEEKSVLASKCAKYVEEMSDLKSQLEKATNEHDEALKNFRSEAEQQEQKLKSQLDLVSAEKETEAARANELAEMVASNEQKLKSMSDEAAVVKTQLDNALEEKTRLEETLAQSRDEVKRLSDEIADLKQQIAETSERIARETEKVRTECRAEQERLLKEQRDAHAEQLEKVRKQVDEYKDLYAKETQLRRAVHDELMDLRGNIRVFARVRPVLPDERRMAEDRQGAGAADIVTEFPAESGGRDIIIKRDGAREGADSKFEFDRVFAPNAKQEEVFETVAPLVTSVMDGVNVTLFAYGQTGSGKTFTMEGPKDNPGVNIRALQRVFEIARERSQTYSYTFTVSVLEVYLETILDLLGDVESNDAREKLDIRQHPDTKQVFVQGLTKRPVTNMAEVQEILQLASKNRTVGAHNMNEHSSRSHLVFTLTAIATSLLKKERLEGNLNLIDLAGSERVSKTDATGDRLKEAQSINKSLSALGDVINALALKNGHIPFRNSKLTFLLSDQLSGSAKVGFFANISPTAFNSSETICTLNFASRCRKTELGKAKKNVVGSESVEQLQKENARLKRLLDEAQLSKSTLGDASFVSTSGTPSTPVRTQTPAKSAASTGGIKRSLTRDTDKE